MDRRSAFAYGGLVTRLELRARLVRIFLVATPLLTCACASLGSRHVAQPGYQCVAGSFDPRQGWAYVHLDEQGRQVHAHWRWTGDVDQTRLWVRASATIEGEGPLRATDGAGAVTWVRAWTDRSRPPQRRLELASGPAPGDRNVARFAGEFARDRPEIQLSWADMTAFARETSTLVVLVRNREGNIVDRADIDRTVLAHGEARIAALLEQLRAKVADFRRNCHHVADLDPEIILT